MKQLLRRVVVKDGVAIKQLPYVIEHDAIKALYTEADKQNIPISQEYKVKNEIEDDTTNVYHITIKWMDGETSNITATETSADEFFSFVFLNFENIYDGVIEDESDDNEDTEDDYESEEEIEEEMLDSEKIQNIFPTSTK